MMRKTPHFSYSTGSLPKGCTFCVKGQKTVVFITGICPNHCFYCPISEQKHQKDVVHINEWPTKSIKDLFTEIRLCSSKGAGITGGDPLAMLDRTIMYIQAMKREFGKAFHIHLYTPLELVNKAALKRLHDAGLDEIRFHPEIGNPKLWERMRLAKQFSWNLGIEIPAIPGFWKETRELIDFSEGLIDFLNINELEISDTNAQQLLERGFIPKDRISYGVKGSEALAKKLLLYAEKKGIPTHYCTSKLKDKVQLSERIKRRAKNAAQKFDIVTKEGMLVRGAVYAKDLKTVKNTLDSMKIASTIDTTRRRVLLSAAEAEDNAKVLKKYGKVAIVEEYPTFDCMNVQTVYL
jgi:pyruvate formate-lyase activating enzyme-like uncharacterized protein